MSITVNPNNNLNVVLSQAISNSSKVVVANQDAQQSSADNASKDNAKRREKKQQSQNQVKEAQNLSTEIKTTEKHNVVQTAKEVVKPTLTKLVSTDSSLRQLSFTAAPLNSDLKATDAPVLENKLIALKGAAGALETRETAVPMSAQSARAILAQSGLTNSAMNSLLEALAKSSSLFAKAELDMNKNATSLNQATNKLTQTTLKSNAFQVDSNYAQSLSSANSQRNAAISSVAQAAAGLGAGIAGGLGAVGLKNASREGGIHEKGLESAASLSVVKTGLNPNELKASLRQLNGSDMEIPKHANSLDSVICESHSHDEKVAIIGNNIKLGKTVEDHHKTIFGNAEKKTVDGVLNAHIKRGELMQETKNSKFTPTEELKNLGFDGSSVQVEKTEGDSKITSFLVVEKNANDKEVVICYSKTEKMDRTDDAYADISRVEVGGDWTKDIKNIKNQGALHLLENHKEVAGFIQNTVDGFDKDKFVSAMVGKAGIVNSNEFKDFSTLALDKHAHGAFYEKLGVNKEVKSGETASELPSHVAARLAKERNETRQAWSSSLGQLSQATNASGQTISGMFQANASEAQANAQKGEQLMGQVTAALQAITSAADQASSNAAQTKGKLGDNYSGLIQAVIQAMQAVRPQGT